MKEDYIEGELIYSVGEDSGPLYILQSGEVEILSTNEKGNDFRIERISQPGEIFGITETVINQKRFNSARAIKDCKLKIIDLTGKDLKQTIKLNPLLGLNISINLSKSFQRRNSFLNEITKIFKGVKNSVNTCCLNYFNLVENINKLGAKFKYPWLTQVYEKAKKNIIYNYGDSASKGKDIIEQELVKKGFKLTDDDELSATGARTFKKGEIVCIEGDIGSEMFILMNGVLCVFVGDHKVAEIKDKGAIIGEIAVLLGYSTKKYEKRTATVKAKEDSQVIVIPGPNLKPVIKKDPKLIVHITKTLAERLPETDSAILTTDNQYNKYLALVNKLGTTSGNCPKAFEAFINDLRTSGKNNIDIIEKYLKDAEQYAEESKQLFDVYESEYLRLANL